jgi:hypothetical protein
VQAVLFTLVQTKRNFTSVIFCSFIVVMNTIITF